MDSAEKAKSPQAYCFPTAGPMQPSEQLSLSTEIQGRITAVTHVLDNRLRSLVAAVIPRASERTRILPTATMGLRRAVLSHVIDSPKGLDGLADRVYLQIRPECLMVPEARLRESAVEHFGLLDGEAQAVMTELATINELATRFVDPNMGLVRKIAKLFKPVSLTQEDLWQEGALALRAAALQYQPDSGAKFGTFAYPIVKHHLTDKVRESACLTDYCARKLEEFAFAKETLVQKLSRNPTNLEVFDELGWPSKTRKSIESALGVLNPSTMPIGAEVSGPEGSMHLKCSPTDTLIASEDRQQLASRLQQLPHDEAAVITKHYYQKLSLRDIAKQDGKSDQSIRQLHDSALARLGRVKPEATGGRPTSKGA